jgi:simple sugar transport system permease protein
LNILLRKRRELSERFRWFEGTLSVAAPALVFLLASSAFFALLGRDPLALIGQILNGAFGSTYGIVETLVKTIPILLCALATAVPARLGLLSVGASGQFYAGAWLGTGMVLVVGGSHLAMPAMFLAACAGGAIWALVPGFLRAQWEVNETLATLLLNYVASLLVDWAVYGPWRDTSNLGWPATISFPESVRLPVLVPGSRLHAGLLLAILLAVGLHILLSRSRWGLELRVLRSNRKLGEGVGMSWKAGAAATMAIGGAVAGLAGILETSCIHGRLQSGIALNYGLTGFLVAWMSGQHMLRIVPISLVMGALLSSGDALQLFAQLPEATAVVLQAILFCSVLATGGLLRRWRSP